MRHLGREERGRRSRCGGAAARRAISVASRSASARGVVQWSRARTASSLVPVRLSPFVPARYDITYCLSLYFLACTFLGPSRKRGPPKGYIDAIEARLHQTEALIGILLSSKDSRAKSLLEDLSEVGYLFHFLCSTKWLLDGRSMVMSRRVRASSPLFSLNLASPGPRSLTVFHRLFLWLLGTFC